MVIGPWYKLMRVQQREVEVDISKRPPLSGSIVVDSCFRVPEGQRTLRTQLWIFPAPLRFEERKHPPLRFPSLKTFQLFVCISCSSFSPGFVTTLSICMIIDKVSLSNFLYHTYCSSLDTHSHSTPLFLAVLVTISTPENLFTETTAQGGGILPTERPQ